MLTFKRILISMGIYTWLVFGLILIGTLGWIGAFTTGLLWGVPSMAWLDSKGWL